MDVSHSWSAHEWMNRGSELLDTNPWLAKRLLARGLQMTPSEAIAWFNLGIGLHQQRRIAAAVRAYRHCLALLTAKKTGRQHITTWRKILLLLGRWQEGGVTTRSVLHVNRATHPLFERSFGQATEVL